MIHDGPGIAWPGVRAWYSRTFVSLENGNYRRFFLGQSVSLIGTWMQSVAQAWLVLDLTGSGTALGLVVAVQTLPILLLLARRPPGDLHFIAEATISSVGPRNLSLQPGSGT